MPTAVTTNKKTMNTEQDAEEEGLSLLERERRRGTEITQNEDADADDDGVLSDRDFETNEVDDGNATGAPSDQRKRQPAPGAGGATAHVQQPNLVPASATQQTNTTLPFPPVIKNPNVAAPQTPQPANGFPGTQVAFTPQARTHQAGTPQRVD